MNSSLGFAASIMLQANDPGEESAVVFCAQPSHLRMIQTMPNRETPVSLRFKNRSWNLPVARTSAQERVIPPILNV